MKYLLVSNDARDLENYYINYYINKVASTLVDRKNKVIVLTLENDSNKALNPEILFSDQINFNNSLYYYELLSVTEGQTNYHIIKVDILSSIDSLQYKLLLSSIVRYLLVNFYKLIDHVVFFDYCNIVSIFNLELSDQVNFHFFKIKKYDNCDVTYEMISTMFEIPIDKFISYDSNDGYFIHSIINRHLSSIYSIYSCDTVYYENLFDNVNCYELPYLINEKEFSPLNAQVLAVPYEFRKFSVAKRMNNVALQQKINGVIKQKSIYLLVRIIDNNTDREVLKSMINFCNSNQIEIIFSIGLDVSTLDQIKTDFKIIRERVINRLSLAACDLFLCFDTEFDDFSHVAALKYGTIPIVPNSPYYTKDLVNIDLSEYSSYAHCIAYEKDRIVDSLKIVKNLNTNHILLQNLQKDNMLFDTSTESLKLALSNLLK